MCKNQGQNATPQCMVCNNLPYLTVLYRRCQSQEQQDLLFSFLAFSFCICN
nr:MAG TPA: hypothetical protein [Caudoviricetes sp.]